MSGRPSPGSTRRPLRLAAAIAATGALVLVLAPYALVTSVWVGAQAVAIGLRDRAPTYAVAGVGMLAVALVVLSLAVALVGTWQGNSRSRISCIVALAALGLLLLTPAWPVVVAPWSTRPISLAVVAVAIGLLVAALLVDRRSGERIRGLGIAASGLVGAYCLVAMAVGVTSTSIPQFPAPPWSASFDGDPQSGQAIPIEAPVAAPGLAPGQHATIHNDGAMTDAYAALPAVDPESAEVRSFFAGGDCASIVWDAQGRLVAVCVSPTEVRAYILDPTTLEPIVERHLADRPLAGNALTNFSGGGYAVLDARQRLVTPLPGGRIARFDVAADLALVDEFSVGDVLQSGEEITSAIPADGNAVWFVGQKGTVGILRTDAGAASSIDVGGGRPVDIENSFAVSEGAAYVITSQSLVRVLNLDGRPSVDWSLPYDSGERRKPGQTSRASGTTPTLFGDFVAFTDNAEPVMNVVVADISGSDPRVHCRVPVFRPEGSATENSLIAMGSAVYVENNYGYSLLEVAGGRTTVPGFARIDVDDTGCRTAWSNDELSVPSVVSKGVGADGAILTYSRSADWLGVDAWWFTAVDAETGNVRWRRLAGVSPLLNNHYAAAYVGPTGSIYVGTISGIVALIGPPG